MNENDAPRADIDSGDEQSPSSVLDICLITTAPDRVLDLIDHMQTEGHRTIVTSPDRTPTGNEWESFDIVILDRDPDGGYPSVPAHHIHLLVALCSDDEIDSPVVLRAAMRAGARELFPRCPTFHGWSRITQAAAASTPGVSVHFLDPTTNFERTVYLEDSALSIGRDPQNDVAFPHRFVSRRHCRILPAGSRYRVEDLGSRHGTFVGGRKIRSLVLSDGDVIRLGGRDGPELTFHLVLMNENTLQVLESTGLLDRESVNRQVHEIAALLQTFVSLNSDLLLEEILEIVLDRSVEFVDADRGVILLRPVDDSGDPDGHLKMTTARDRHGRPLALDSLEMSQKIPVKVYQTGEGLIVEDVDVGKPSDTMMRKLGIRSAMCVPLKVRKKHLGEDAPSADVIGVLYVDSEGRDRPFSPGSLDALEVLAAEAAMAIYSARLYDESLRNRRLEEEMEIARQIHENIFHDPRYDGPSWQVFGTTRPSQQVGGDFLSCFPTESKGCAVVVGDVSGKGVPAALFSTMLEGLFYGLLAARTGGEDLGAAALELNHFMVSKSRLQKFATSIFGYLGSDGTFRYVNAGHNPGLILRCDGSLEELQTSGTILGMFDEVSFIGHSVRCEPGDALVLYSDGLTDSRDPAGEAYGLDRLRAAAQGASGQSVEGLHERIIRDLESFVSDAESRDDVTLLVIKKKKIAPVAMSS